VTSDEVSCSSAARGVIAININGLLAHSTVDCRRPGDVTIPLWSQGKGLAIDVAVTSPFNRKAVRSSSPCEDYAAQQKHGKYDASFRGKNYLFAAVVFETTGAINEEGARVLSQLARFAAKRQGREFSSFCGRAWVRFSCNLQRSVSQAILNRLEGSPVEVAASPERFVLELPSSVSAVWFRRSVGSHHQRSQFVP